MRFFTRFLSFFIISLSLLSCKSSKIDLSAIDLADDQAKDQAKILFHDIKKVSEEGVAFGHQDATAYGIGWKYEEDPENLRSDIQKVTGAFPAVHGYDLGRLELGNPKNLDAVSFDMMRDHIRKMDKKGGIITMSWHADNPVTNGDSWDTIPAVSAILKGGAEREKYELWMLRLSDFFKSLKRKNGEAIPVVFRPYHEMNGSWFWWGAGNTTPQNYKQLWRETFQLLQENGVHNLLYAYSPNTLEKEEDFDLYYPGDDYVDILGVDIYNHSGNEAFVESLKNDLQIVRKKAEAKEKPFALTESGNMNFGEDPDWWTQTVYPAIKDSGIAWMLVWRNAHPGHYFGTYNGEISEEDFKEFAEKEDILLLDEVQEIRD